MSRFESINPQEASVRTKVVAKAKLDPSVARELLERAKGARGRAYAPYSRFPVAAALLDADGVVHIGVNVENASYGLSTCAERAAVTRAVADGARDFRAIAVVGPEDDTPCMPCGSCRQILYEFGPNLFIVLGQSGEPRVIPLVDLLPDAFETKRLGDRPDNGQ